MIAMKSIPSVVLGLAAALAAGFWLWPQSHARDKAAKSRENSLSLDVRLTGDGNPVDVDVGRTEYGASPVKTLRVFTAKGDPRGVDNLRRIGCGACSKTRVLDVRRTPEEGVYECRLVFNPTFADHRRFPTIADFFLRNH